MIYFFPLVSCFFQLFTWWWEAELMNRLIFHLLVSIVGYTIGFILFCARTQQETTKKANLKRENKAYSFKEQIIDLELKEVFNKIFSRSCLICLDFFCICKELHSRHNFITLIMHHLYTINLLSHWRELHLLKFKNPMAICKWFLKWLK